MNHALRRAEAEARDQTERRQRIIARVVTVLVHLLLLLLLLSSDPLPITEAEGGSAGGSAGNGGLQVTYIDNKPTPPAAAPAVRKPVPKPRTRATPVKSRVVTTPVPQAAEPVPPDAPEEAAKPEPEPEQAVAVEAPPTPRADHVRGQPPGMRVQEIPTASAGSAGNDAGYGSNSSGAGSRGSSMGVDGFQVIYDLVYERQLREWRDQGMTELFLPLPGTRRLMVCPLEVALRRGSSKCRMVEQDDPALASIGDARKVLVMQRIYHLGDEVWSGPGPYR